MEETATNLLESKLPELLAQFRDEILDVTDHRGDLMVALKPGRVREIIRFLKENSATQFNMMMDLFGMDYLKYPGTTPERFAVMYNLYSLPRHRRVHLKVFVSEKNPHLDSIHDIFKAADWFEREAWDLFGITFDGHPNLIRILCHNDFVGHPMRKDYPSDKYQRLKAVSPSSGI